MKALLLLGGLGTRLRPFTFTTPKPLLPVANIPLVSYQFALLKKYGIDHVILGVGYKSKDFKGVTAAAKQAGLKVSLSVENKPLGTGGGIRNAYKFLSSEKEPFLVFNGDILADFNLQKILDSHKENASAVTIGLVKVANPSAYGLVITDEAMRVKRFIEKPSQQDLIADTINAGVYIFNSPEIIKDIPEGKEISIEKEVFPGLVEQDKKVFGYTHYGYWLDVGTIDSYKKANFDVLEGKFVADCQKEINPPLRDGVINEGNLVLGKNSFIAGGVKIRGNVVIGDECFIGQNSFLKDAVILDHSAVKHDSCVTNVIIGKETYIGEYSRISDAVLPDKSLLRYYARAGISEEERG